MGMTKTTLTNGNTVTTLLDLTEGIGNKTAEEILELSDHGAVKEFSEILPDGRIVTYSLQVEEEILEEEEDIEIVTNKTVTSVTLEGSNGVVESFTNTQEGEAINVMKINSRTVTDGTESRKEIIKQEDREAGWTSSFEHTRHDANDTNEDKSDTMAKTEVSSDGILITTL